MPVDPSHQDSLSEAAELGKLLRRALLVRVSLAIALHALVPEPFFAPDQTGYHFGSRLLAAWWAGQSGVFPARILEGHSVGYFYIVASLYFALGPWPLLPKLLNAGVGALSVRLVYRLARSLLDNHEAAMHAARLAAFLPSMVLWSVLNIRDIWVIFVLLLICTAAVRLQHELDGKALVLLTIGLLGLDQLRSYLLLPVAVPLVATFALRRRGSFVRVLLVALVVAGVLNYVDVLGGPGRRIRSADLEILQEIREGTASGGRSNFMPDADISTPEGALTFLPLGLAFFLFAPFPWSITGLRQVITLPEMLYLYSMVPSMWRGALRFVQARAPVPLFVVLITASLTIGYALGQSNAGTAYRHRAQVLPFLMIFAAAGRKATPAAGLRGRT